MGAVMDGEATPAQLAAMLMGLRMRGETVDELAGFATAMRERVRQGRSARGCDRRRRDGWRRQWHVQHLDDGGARRRGRRRSGGQARQPRDHLAGRFGRRPRCTRGPDRPRRGLRGRGPPRDRLCLHVRPEFPPGHEARGPDPAGNRRSHGVQPPRSAHEPGRDHAPAARRGRPRGGGPDGRGRPAARHRADVRDPRRWGRRAATRRERRGLHRGRRHGRTARHRRRRPRVQAGGDGPAVRRHTRRERPDDRVGPPGRARDPARRRPAQRRAPPCSWRASSGRWRRGSSARR